MLESVGTSPDVAGGALAIAPALGAVVAASLFPGAMGSPLTWSAGALVTGATLIVVARRAGLGMNPYG